MKLKLNKNLSLPWTPQGEKASGNHQILLPRKNASSLICPYAKLTRSHFLTLSSRVSCINSLTSPTALLWPIHDHSHKYLYQLSSTCEQKPIGKKQHIYERKSHEAKMADFRVPDKLAPRLSISWAKMYAFLVPRVFPSSSISSKNLLQDDRTLLDKNIT